MGRWKSLAFLQQMQFLVLAIISSTCFTVADLIATHPGFSPTGEG